MSSGPVPAALAAFAFAAASLALPAAAAPPTNCDKCFALVNIDGTLSRKRNVSLNYRHATGTYEIVFAYPVDKCYVSTQIQNVIATTVVSRGSQVGNPANRSVLIFTVAPDGGPRGSGFGIYVFC